MAENHSPEEISKKQDKFAKEAPRVGSYWRHYKGKIYKITGFTMRESNEEMEVSYISIMDYQKYPFGRPYYEWTQTVDVLGIAVPRYQLVELACYKCKEDEAKKRDSEVKGGNIEQCAACKKILCTSCSIMVSRFDIGWVYRVCDVTCKAQYLQTIKVADGLVK